MISSIFKLPSTDRIKADSQQCVAEIEIQISMAGIPAPLLTSCVTLEKFLNFPNLDANSVQLV